MLFKKHVILFIVVMFIFSAAAPVYAAPEGMVYDKTYDLDGTLLLKIQSGDKDSSAAQQKSLIEGRGSYFRDESVVLEASTLNVHVDSDWSVDPSNLWGLSVFSTIELNEDLVEQSEDETDQVFAVKVETGSGEEGSLNQDMTATAAANDENDNFDFDEKDQINSFVIDQEAYTSGGEMKRYIELICPVSGGYLFEDSVIKGYANVTDSLRPAGEQGDNDNPDDGFDQPEETVSSKEDVLTKEDLSSMEAERSNEEEQYSSAENVEEEEGPVFVLESEHLQSSVLLNTSQEELNLPGTFSLTAEMFEITGIEVEWSKESIPEYNPDQAGSYIFEGEMSFPENVLPLENMVLIYTVHVVEELEDEDEIETGTENNEVKDKLDEETAVKEQNKSDENNGEKAATEDNGKDYDGKEDAGKDTAENSNNDSAGEENGAGDKQDEQDKDEDSSG